MGPQGTMQAVCSDVLVRGSAAHSYACCRRIARPEDTGWSIWATLALVPLQQMIDTTRTDERLCVIGFFIVCARMSVLLCEAGQK